MKNLKKISKIEKLFVEPDEEIVFTLEKIIKAEGSRAILVIPHNAALITSSVSLKILARQIAKSEKLVVLVSDTDVGMKLASKANLVAKKRISEVTKQVWDKAKELKESWLLERERVKKELIGARKEEQIAEEASSEKTVGTGKSVVGQQMVKAKVLEEETVAEPILIPEKVRLPEKIVEINGIRVFSGGDITDNVELLMSERDKNLDENDIEEMERQIEELKEKKILEDEVKDQQENGFVGTDVTGVASSLRPSRVAPKPNLKHSLGQKFSGLNKAFLKLAEGKKLTKILVIFFLLAFVFIAISYLFYSSVSVTLIFAENTIKVNKNVTASSDITEIDFQNLKLPAAQLSKSSSISEEGVATGKGKKGEVAKGVVTLYNKTDKAITIKAGTLITNISSTLKYKLSNDVTIAANGDMGDQPIQAETFGENYNINVDSVITLSVAGYTTDKVVAYSFRDVTGGTSQDIVVVSKEDLDAMKASLEEKLKKELLDNLNTLISGDDVLLQGSEKFTINEFKSTVAENAEGDKFTADLKMSITALKIVKSNLQEIAEELARQESGGDMVSQIKVSDPLVENIVIAENGKSATFELRSNAGVIADVDEEAIKEELKGKSIDQAREYLGQIPGLEEYKIKYNPPFIPFFMQKVPDDLSKISVVKETVENK